MQTISQKNSKTIMKNDSHLEILYSQMKRANAKTFLVPNFYFWTFLSTKILKTCLLTLGYKKKLNSFKKIYCNVKA